MTAGMTWEVARGAGRSEKEASLSGDASVCGGMQPTTTSLTFLLMDE